MKTHSDLTRSLLKGGRTDFQESGPEDITIGSFQALRYRLTTSMNGIDITYWHVTIETDDHFHQMLLWCLKSTFEKNIPDFNVVIQSFEATNDWF